MGKSFCLVDIHGIVSMTHKKFRWNPEYWTLLDIEIATFIKIRNSPYFFTTSFSEFFQNHSNPLLFSKYFFGYILDTSFIHLASFLTNFSLIRQGYVEKYIFFYTFLWIHFGYILDTIWIQFGYIWLPLWHFFSHKTCRQKYYFCIIFFWIHLGLFWGNFSLINLSKNIWKIK